MIRKHLTILFAVTDLSGCANNPYASNATTADTTGGALLGALAGAAIGAGVGGVAGYTIGHSQNNQHAPERPGYYAPHPNDPPYPTGYTCVPNQ